MNRSWTDLVIRFLFVVAFLLLTMAGLERIANFAGYTLINEVYTPGRMLELAGILLLFVISLLLRDIRNSKRQNQ